MPKTKSKPKNSKKTAVKKPLPAAPAVPVRPRVLTAPKRVWHKPLTWRNSPPVPNYEPLPKARLLFMGVLKQLWRHKKLFGGIIFIYGLLNVLLVRGLAGSNDLTSLKSTLDNVAQGFSGKVTSTAASFVFLLASSGSGNTATSGVYQAVLLIVCSLAFVWAFRQTNAGVRVRIRDSFYRGMYPLVPFLLLFALLGLQLVPLAAGSGLYSMIVSNGIAVHAWEVIFWLLVFVGLGVWSLRMVTASIFALYIVTLPDMTPLKAYRSARKLVYGRRLLLWRKLIFLPIVLILLAVLIELPLILFLTSLAPWVFFALSMAALPVIHGYLYNLYREML